jgi:hypothetical protein
MGVPVYSFDDFSNKFQELRQKKKLFGFFLYDSRPTHDVIEQFTRERHDWLDELAGFGKIYFFFPLRRSKSKEFENPSLEIAKLFDIEPAKLPGIALFSVLPESDAAENKVVFFQLDETIFGDKPQRVEGLFSQLFMLLNECQKSDKPSEELLEDVRLRIEHLRKTSKAGSVWHQFKRLAQAFVVGLPEKMLTAMAEGFGKSVADKAIKGH